MKLRHKIMALGLVAVMAVPFTAMAGEDTSGTAQAPVEQPVAVEDDGTRIYEPENGILKIAAPTDNDQWSVIQDDQSWFVLSDGTDTITVEHYANGDTLPAPGIANDTFVQIYQVFYSTTNEIFIVTGMVTVESDMPYVKDAVNSFEVLKYDTKTKDDTPEPVYDLNPIGTTMYCTTPDGVNVRADHTTNSDVIGGINYRDAVYVNGDVTKDGVDTGWYQIQYGDGIGYVWEDWFDVNQPPAAPVKTGDTMTIYSYDGSLSKEIYFYTDGIWRDDDGITYSGGMSAEVDGSDGSVWYQSPMGPAPTGDSMTIYSYDGSMSKEIYFYTDGVWRDDDGITYSGGMSAEVDGSDGSVWYQSPMGPTPTGDSTTIYSYDGSVSKEIYFYTDGVWRDDEGITYSGGRSAEVDASDGSVWYESPME